MLTQIVRVGGTTNYMNAHLLMNGKSICWATALPALTNLQTQIVQASRIQFSDVAFNGATSLDIISDTFNVKTSSKSTMVDMTNATVNIWRNLLFNNYTIGGANQINSVGS